MLLCLDPHQSLCRQAAAENSAGFFLLAGQRLQAPRNAPFMALMPFSWVSTPLAELNPTTAPVERKQKTMIKSTTQAILTSWVGAYFLGGNSALADQVGARAGLGPVHWNFFGTGRSALECYLFSNPMACNFLGFFGIAKVARKTK